MFHFIINIAFSYQNIILFVYNLLITIILWYRVMFVIELGILLYSIITPFLLYSFSPRHIFKLERCGMWGSWDISWRVAVRNLLHQPTVKDNTILLILRQASLFSFSFLYIVPCLQLSSWYMYYYFKFQLLQYTYPECLRYTLIKIPKTPSG